MKGGLLVVVAAALVGTALGQFTCNQVQFQACAGSLAAALGVSPATALFSNPSQTQALLNTAFSQSGLANIAALCNGLQQFYGCLGNSLGACLGFIGWIRNGRSPQDAYAFDGVLLQHRFQCGIGFDLLYGNPVQTTCVQSTSKNYFESIQQQISAYQGNVQHDPTHACDYVIQMTNAVGSIYYNGPCAQAQGADRNQSYWFGCEGMREWATYSQFTHCQYYADVVCTGKRTVPSQIAEQWTRTNEKGELEIRVPATWVDGKKVEERWI